jgi:hypothetical protein
MVVLLSSTLLLLVGRWARSRGQSALRRLVLALSSSPFAKGRGDQPRLKLINAPTLAIGDEFPMNSWPTSEKSQNANFAYTEFSEVHGKLRLMAISYRPLCRSTTILTTSSSRRQA